MARKKAKAIRKTTKGKEYFASDDKRDYNKNKTSHVLTKKDKNKKGK